MLLQEPGQPGTGKGSGATSELVRAVRLWCRRRARANTEWAKRIQPMRHQGLPHEEIRYRLKLTVSEYRRVRRWMDNSMRQSAQSEGSVSFEEALAQQEERQVDLVTRFVVFKRAGATGEQIRQRLELTHEGYDLTNEWYRDALAAIKSSRPRD